MSFEQSLETRGVGATAKEPTDLDYYAKPENYEGSNMHTISRFVYTARKEEKDKHADENDHINQRLKSMYDRYKDICADDSSSSDTSSDSRRSKEKHIYRLPHSHTLATMNLNSRNNLPKQTNSRTNNINNLHSKTGPVEKSHSSVDFRTLSTTPPPQKSPPPPPVQAFDNVDDDEDDDAVVAGRPTSSKSRGSDHQRKISMLSTMSGPYISATTSLTNITANDLTLLMAKEKFRHAIKLVLILLKWISTLTEKEDEEGNVTGGKTFTDIASEAFEAGKIKNTGIAFDVSQFKARKEMSVSNEVRHILSIPSEARTPEQLQTALFGLQHLKSFAEYPLHMQEKLCKVAWFQQVPHKKVIIRQGHFAENFYFILSGQAVVRILDKNPKTGEVSLRTAAVMRKGTSFGELALLHRSRRTATVVSQDMVQLLSIGREDFLDIFMNRSGGPDTVPEHIQFVNGMDFMQGWPIERLLERPECCLFHFFKRGVVIVKDSNQSEWLYIVKSGSCQVMKRLKGVRPQTTNSQLRSGSQSSREDDTHRKLPKLDNLMGPETKIDSGRQKKQKRVRIVSPVRRAMEEYEEYMQQKENTPVESSKKQVQDNQNEDNTPTATNKKATKSATERTSTSQSNASTKPGYSKSKFALFPKAKTSLPYFDMTNNSIATSSAQSRSILRKSHSAKIIRKNNEKQTVEETITQLEDIGPVFVQVEKLKPKDIFGLSSVHFEETIDDPGTSVSLVSNGAECIMLSKKFFITHATELTKKIVRHSVHPYPSEESLQQNLQTKVDWDVYKRHLVDDMVSSIQLFRTQDKQTNLPDIRASVR